MENIADSRVPIRVAEISGADVVPMTIVRLENAPSPLPNLNGKRHPNRSRNPLPNLVKPHHSV